MFGLGMLIGVFLGGIVGIFIAALCRVSAQADEERERHIQQMEKEETCGNEQK
jgi:ethanolamine transporter EutH